MAEGKEHGMFRDETHAIRRVLPLLQLQLDPGDHRWPVPPTRTDRRDQPAWVRQCQRHFSGDTEPQCFKISLRDAAFEH